jgi:hypothetical protein
MISGEEIVCFCPCDDKLCSAPNDPKKEWTRSPAHKILISVQIVNFTENFFTPVSKVLIPFPKRLAFKDLKMVKYKNSF